MTVVGFSFNKFNCERKEASHPGKVSISHALNIDKVVKAEVAISGSKNPILKVHFNFDILYSGGLGKISLSGELIYSDSKEIIEESIKTWNADKKLTSVLSKQVHKFVYNKAIIKALELSNALSLPAPIPLPKISVNQPKK